MEELRPATTEIVENLLQALPSRADPDGTVDLRKHFAYPVPMQVISDLFGIPDHERPELRDAVDKIFRSDLSPGWSPRTRSPSTSSWPASSNSGERNGGTTSPAP